MARHTLPFLLLALAPLLPTAQGQSSTLVVDIDPTGTPIGSDPEGSLPAGVGPYQGRSFTEFGGHWYFKAQTLTTGFELWRTDGTAAGTGLFLDIVPGPEHSLPSNLTASGGLLYFVTDTAAEGRELWRTDGTAAGTFQVKDILPGPGDGILGDLVGMGGKLYFTATDGATGVELWSSDGTSAGTNLVLDIDPGPGSSLPTSLAADPSGGLLVFSADDKVHGKELWKSDGTAAGTQLVSDLNPGSTDTPIDRFVFVAGRAFFAAKVGALGWELWTTDGTAAGTQLVLDIHPGTDRDGLNPGTFAASAIEFGGELYFGAGSGPFHNGLWKVDGATLAATPLHSTTSERMTSASQMTASAGTVYLQCITEAQVSGLWKVVGNQTELIIEFGIGLDDITLEGQMIGFGQGVLFEGKNVQTGHELYVSDGTAVGTQLVQDIFPGGSSSFPDWITVVAPGLALFAAEATLDERELWSTDGTAAGTSLFANLEPAEIPNGSLFDLFPVDDQRLLFRGGTAAFGLEPWVWDPVGGATMLANIQVDQFSSSPSDFVKAWVGGHQDVFFTAESAPTGRELWHTDGTPAGTNMVIDLVSGTKSGVRGGLFAAGGWVYFLGVGQAGGLSVWKSDGSVTGPIEVFAIPSGKQSIQPNQWMQVGNKVYFDAQDTIHGEELWCMDLTTEAVSLVIDLEPSTGSGPTNLTRVGDRLAFTAYTATTGNELWITDGTAAGTQLIADTIPGASSGFLSQLLASGDHLYFSAFTPSFGTELWMYDGVSASMLVDLNPGPDYSTPSGFLLVGDTLFFSADTPGAGRELWTTDGTAAGTSMVLDLWPGPDSGLDYAFTGSSMPAGSGVYFRGDDGVDGSELFFSDGTAAGTVLVSDLASGSASGDPRELVMLGDRLFTIGSDPLVGNALYELFDTRALSADLGLSGGGPKLSASPPVLGASFELRAVDGPAGSVGFLVASGPAPVAYELVTLPGSVAWLDLPSFWIVGPLAPGSTSMTLPVPAVPGLQGQLLNLQAWYLPGASLPAVTSNGVRLRLGD
ncbi:MAG: hypothetical protein P1V81_09625 [Planctomycetota bacterium]|nr:hypothetical protein [Planctomycetota bacterium]